MSDRDQVTDEQRDRDEPDDVRDERLHDLAPPEQDAGAIKGGGPKEQQTRPGGGPTD